MNLRNARDRQDVHISWILSHHALLLAALALGYLYLPQMQEKERYAGNAPIAVIQCTLATYLPAAIMLFVFGPLKDCTATIGARLVRGLLGALGGATIFYAIAIVYGVPLLDRVLASIFWSLLMSALVVMPSACILGGKSEDWIRLFARSSPESLPEIAVCIPGHGVRPPPSSL